MKEKIVQIEKGKEGIALPADFLRYLELIPGAEVEVKLDKDKKWILVRPLHAEDFLDHFKDAIDSMS